MNEPVTLASPPPNFDISALTLEANAKSLVDYIQRETASLISSFKDGATASFEAIILPLAEIDNEVKTQVQYMALFQAVSTCPDIRMASSVAVSLVDKAYLSMFQDDNLFSLMERVRDHASLHERDEEDLRFFDRYSSMFEENGMCLTGESRDRFIWISHRLIELRVKFMEILGTDPGHLWKSEQQLAGVPLNKLSTRVVEDGLGTLFQIPLTRPVTNLILAECQISQTRQDVFVKNCLRYPENVEIFREIVILRDEASRLLGFPSFAARKLSHQMLGSPGRVNSFLEYLHDALKPLAEAEILKLQDLANTNEPIHLWDFDFYHTRMLQEKSHVDHEYISQWFPARVTIQRMLGIYGELFGLQFKKIDVFENSSCTWHPDVEVYSVWEEHMSSFIGYLYLDIFPRAGKYNHAANFNIHPVGPMPPVGSFFITKELSNAFFRVTYEEMATEPQ